jgi:hypothetical protein
VVGLGPNNKDRTKIYGGLEMMQTITLIEATICNIIADLLLKNKNKHSKNSNSLMTS